ncbi:hypothetical protein BP00DRAFT_440275 [Aspergillus indologenus CBS 114.80]|uniref:Protein kinase domain-containing protein n=1 Tax=Aspergillus indologenus CBS 114.80 TaxID=1450541 RepID=A0A2V5HQK0_9EURO|nr:hypothetical protein BP00DRAFT_440275 [Aspergillus indologenus CBS 114.80]
MEVKPLEVESFKKLKESKYSVVFKVRFQQRTCALKVYYNCGWSKFNAPDCKVNLFISKSTVYSAWPDLYIFINNRLPPNAILFKYIPNIQLINLSNFSEQFIGKLRVILDDIHRAEVLYSNPKPCNMMVSSGDCKRNIIFPPRQEKWFKEEVEMVDYFVDALARDFEEGRLNRTVLYYYDWFHRCFLQFVGILVSFFPGREFMLRRDALRQGASSVWGQ